MAVTDISVIRQAALDKKSSNAKEITLPSGFVIEINIAGEAARSEYILKDDSNTILNGFLGLLSNEKESEMSEETLETLNTFVSMSEIKMVREIFKQNVLNPKGSELLPHLDAEDIMFAYKAILGLEDAADEVAAGKKFRDDK